MRLVIGADHAGYDLKHALIPYLVELGHEVEDIGTDGPASVDYPDYAESVGNAIREGRADRGILICGSGIGASIAANKMSGIRAGLAHDTYSARQGVEHDDMNVLVLGGRIIGTQTARELVKAFLSAEFSRDDRHMKRLNKVLALEEKY